MGELRVYQPPLHFVFPEWYPEFKEHVTSTFIIESIASSTLNEEVVHFDRMVALSVEWVYRVCSQEEFGDDRYYEILSPDEAEGEDFYDEVHWSDDDFREDLFNVMKALGLHFYTDKHGYHNVPIVRVW